MHATPRKIVSTTIYVHTLGKFLNEITVTHKVRDDLRRAEHVGMKSVLLCKDEGRDRLR